MEINPYDMNPDTAIRSDLWGTMNLDSLMNQQRLVTNRMHAAGNLLTGAYANENMRIAYYALQHAAEQLTDLINQAASKRKA